MKNKETFYLHKKIQTADASDTCIGIIWKKLKPNYYRNTATSESKYPRQKKRQIFNKETDDINKNLNDILELHKKAPVTKHLYR